MADGGLLPDANGTDPNPGGQTDGSKWQKPRLTRKSLMKCCLVKWIIASTTQQGPGTSTSTDTPPLTPSTTTQRIEYLHGCVWQQGKWGLEVKQEGDTLGGQALNLLLYRIHAF